MQCPNCEAENRDGARFCDSCGFPLSGAIARAAGGVSPAEGSLRREAGLPSDPPRPDRAGAPDAQLPEAGANPFHMEPAYGLGETWLNSVPADFTNPFEDNAAAPLRPIGTKDRDFDRPGADDRLGEGIGEEPWAYGDATAEPALDPSGRTEALESLAVESGYFPERDGEGADASADQAPAPLGEVPDGWKPSSFTMEMPRLERSQPVQGRDFRVAATPPNRRGAKVAAFVVAGILLGALAAALVTYALGIWGGVGVPDVTGMTEQDAAGELASEGFSVRVAQVKSDDTEGLVLITDPPAGSRAPEGSEVVVHIATARFVPDIVGKSGEEARRLLEESGYENVRFDMRKSDGEEDVVLEVSPEPGTRAKSNTDVVVKVSEAYRVPDLDGLSADAALDAVADAGLSPEIVYIDTDQFPDGTITGVYPEPGTKVSEGSPVQISVARARGVELVGLTEQMFSTGNTVTIGGVDYEIESLVSVSYQGDDTVAFTASGRPKITFFGETLYASSSQTVTGQVVWSPDNEVVSIS